MARSGLRVCGLITFVVLSVALVEPAIAANLDKNGEIKLGVRTYVNARVGTENTDYSSDVGKFDPTDSVGIRRKSRTFPYSPAGHLRQNRFFAEVELKHDLARLQKEGFGPFSLMNQLPSWMRVRNLQYGLTYRGEGDGLYDWGPSEFRTAHQWGSEDAQLDPTKLGNNCGTFGVKGCVSRNPATGANVPVGALRKRLRDLGTTRSRLFQAYVDADVGDHVWLRFGRQIMSWGETDAFRLIDNINPVDNSFGGFLIPLDERRVPLDMLRAQVRVGDVGPLSDTFFEFYGAIDEHVGYAPGSPSGSPWGFPNTGVPGANTLSQREQPARNFSDMRGGGRYVFNLGDGTFSLAHYYTYFDTPAIQTYVQPGFPVNPQYSSTDLDVNSFADSAMPNGGWSVLAVQKAPLTQVSGASMTFAFPELYTIMRSEFAYFHNEARFAQSQLDPFVYHFFKKDDSNGFEAINPSVRRNACSRIAAARKAGITDAANPNQADFDDCRLTGGRRLGDSINMAIGFDINQFIRALNPHQTFFISTQFFYKHLLGAIGRRKISDDRIPQEGEVLPVTEFDTYVPNAGLASFGAVEPNLISQPTDSFLQTFLITTSYRSGTIVPAFVCFYDWGGALVFQPSVGFIQDPFRLSIDYSILAAGRYKGGSGVSLLKDRDSIQFRIEYVI